MNRIQVIAKNVNFPSAAAAPPPPPAALCDKADCRALRSTIVFVNYFLWYTAVGAKNVRFEYIEIHIGIFSSHFFF